MPPVPTRDQEEQLRSMMRYLEGFTARYAPLMAVLVKIFGCVTQCAELGGDLDECITRCVCMECKERSGAIGAEELPVP